MPPCRSFAKGDFDGPPGHQPAPAATVFVPGHPALDARVAALHARLPFDPAAQAKIDAHLLAAAYAAAPGARALDPLRLVVLPEDAPQLANLPVSLSVRRRYQSPSTSGHVCTS